MEATGRAPRTSRSQKTQENDELRFLPHSVYSVGHGVGLHRKRLTQQSLTASFVGGPQVVGDGEGRLLSG